MAFQTKALYRKYLQWLRDFPIDNTQIKVHVKKVIREAFVYEIFLWETKGNRTSSKERKTTTLQERHEKSLSFLDSLSSTEVHDLLRKTEIPHK